MVISITAAKPNAPTHTEVPLFRMLSNPVHVDQIEKQQRVKTPQDDKNSPNGYGKFSYVDLNDFHNAQVVCFTGNLKFIQA